MSKGKVRKQLLEKYSYFVPTIILILYILYVVLGVNGKLALNWIADSKNFVNMCELITQFSSIVLGVYGIFIPVVIGKQDRFTNYFWQNINRDKFAKDVHKIILSGIFVIILSIVLTVSDIMNKKIVMILVGMMVWVLFFYACCTYRFLGIFIQLIVGSDTRKSDDDLLIEDPISDKDKNNLNKDLDQF